VCNWSVVGTGTPPARQPLFFSCRGLRAKIEDASATAMSHEGGNEIATALNVALNGGETMEMRLSASDQSLNAPIAESGEDAWQDFLADDRLNPEQVVIGLRDAESRSRWLEAALRELSDRERKIIERRRLVDEDAATLEELGRELGVSKERVRQLESRAMGKLRAAIVENVSQHDDLLLEAEYAA